LPAASLTKRFLITLLLSAAVPLVAFAWFAIAGMRERMERRIGDVYLPQLASDAAITLAARLEQARKSLAVLSTAAANLLADPARRAEFEEQARLLPGVNEDFDLILVVADDGRVVQAQYNPRLDPATRAAREKLRPERITSPWFDAIRAGQSEVWLDRHLSPFLHRTVERHSRDPADHHLGLALRIEGPAPGCLFALVRWARVQELIDATAGFLRDPEQAGLPSAHCFLIDEHGLVLAHTNRARYGERLQRRELLDQMYSGDRVLVAFVDSDGEARRGGAVRIDGLPSPLRWWLGLHVRENQLFSTSRDYARVLTITIAALVAFLAVWSVIASRAISRPVRDLAEATRRLAAGDLDARVASEGPAELGELSRAFNQMASDLQRSREQLRAAERQAAWAEMARQVAHEIKNPLTPMRMSAQLLQRARQAGDPRVPELSDRLARTVLEQTDVLARIANDFRQFAGPARRTRERVPIDALLADLDAFFADLAEVRGVALSIQRPPSSLAVEGDRQELGRVLVNLVQNAIDAGARGIDVRADGEDGAVSLTVVDDGAGMPAETQGRLFEPYFTTKTSGTGLGLAICRRIVEAHGGEITLQSSRPGATVFRIRLPRAEGMAAAGAG